MLMNNRELDCFDFLSTNSQCQESQKKEFLNHQIEEAYLKIENALQRKVDNIGLLQKKIDKAIMSIHDPSLWHILKNMMKVNINSRACIEEVLKNAEALNGILEKN